MALMSKRESLKAQRGGNSTGSIGTRPRNISKGTAVEDNTPATSGPAVIPSGVQEQAHAINDFATALTQTLGFPAQQASQPQLQLIQTPELDSAVGNTRPTGETWEDTNALARDMRPTFTGGGGTSGGGFGNGTPATPARPDRNVAGGITQRQFDTAQRMSEEEGSPFLAFGRGLFSTQNDYSIPEGLTEREQRAYRTGLNTADAAQNLPAIIAEFGDNAVQSFVYPWREREANTQDPQIVQRAARAGDVTGLAAIGGLGAASAGIASTAQMVEDLVSKNNVHDPLTERTLRDFGRVQQAIAEQTADWSPKQKEYYNYAIEAFRMVPDMVLAWMTAGGSEAASLANQTTNAFARYATGLATNPVFYSTALQMTGNSYQEALEKGADEKTAALYGTLNGILNAALEVGGAQELPGEIAGAPFRNAMLDWLKSIPEEGGEEVIQGIVEKALGAIILGEDGKTISITDKDAILSLARAVDEFKGGAILSGILGGANVATNAALSGYNENPLAQTILANEQGGQEQGSEFNTPQAAQANEPALGQAGMQTTPTNAQSEAQARVTEILSGTMSNSRADAIASDPALRAAFTEMTGVELTGTKSEMRNAVKEYARETATIIDTNPANHTPEQQQTVNAYVQATDKGFLQWISKVRGLLRKDAPAKMNYTVAPVSDAEADAIYSLTGIDAAGFSHNLNGENFLNHIVDEHGENGSTDQNMRHDADVARMAYVIQNYDEIELAHDEEGNLDTNWRYRDRDNNPAPKIVYKKVLDGTYYIVEAVPDSGKKRLQIITAYMGPSIEIGVPEFDSGTPIEGPRVSDANNAPAFTPEAAHASPSTDTVPQTAPAVNGENTPSSPIAEAVLNNEQQTPPTEQQPGQVRSQSEANTIQAMDERLNAPEESRQEIYYTPQSEEESVAQARALLENGYTADNAPGRPNSKLTEEQATALTAAGERLGGGYGQAMADMQSVPVWTTVQQDMSTIMLERLAEDAKATGDWSAYDAWRIVDQQHGEEIARTLQARGKRTRGYTDFLDDVSAYVDGLDLSKEQKDQVLSEVMPYAQEYADIQKAMENGMEAEEAKADLIDLIERVSGERGTGTIIKGNLHKFLVNQDAAYLAQVAEAQFKSLAHDHVPVSTGDRIKSWQTIAQLLKLTTFERNLGGNATFGFMDALVGNTFGVALDRAVSGTTGARAVGFDPRWFSSTQRAAAIDAMQKSMIEIALDVDMGTVGNKYDPRGRAYRMNGGPAERFMSRLSQILSYSLTTSDAFFRGALEAGTTETLNRLNQGNEEVLSQVEDVAKNRADYALFQNQGRTAQTAKAFHDRMNAWLGVGGEVENGRRSGGFGLGDIIMPYATVPANLAVKPFEYSPLGIVKGGIDLAKVLKNAQSGNVNLQAQHNAVMEIARGVTGLPVALLFSTLIRSGIVKRGDDDDDYDVTKARQSEGRRETQWNLDATSRWLQGGDKEWQEGDKLISLNWMEPLNAFMDIGALIADMQDDGDPTVLDYVSKYAIGSIQAAMEMPMIDTLQSAIQAMQYADSDNMWGKLGKFAESTATSAVTGMMPGVVSQIARVMDPTTRDTSADTFMGRFANAIMNATPGLREQLPEKLDSFGNPITNDNPVLNALNNLALPGTISEYAPSEVVQALDSVYDATGRSNFYPDYKAPASFDYDGSSYELNTEEKRSYQQSFGQRYNDLIQSVIDSDEYSQMTDTERAAVFSEMRNIAAAEARGEIVTGRGGEYQSDYDKVKELSDIPGYYATKTMFSTASDERHRDYERMDEILESYGNLPDDVKEALDTGNTANMDKLYNAWSEGVKPENWYKATDAAAALEPYGDKKAVSDWQKYQAMAGAVSDKDMDIILKDYLEDTAYDKYVTARDAGITAQQWADARAEAGKLEPVDGKDTVADWQRYQAYAGVLSDDGMDAMMQGYLEGSALEKYQTARDAGASASDWADAMARAGALQPLEGEKDVKNWQVYQAYAESDSRTADALFEAYLTENQYARYRDARRAGASAQEWAEANAGVAQLTPYGTNKGVSEWQEYEYIAREYPRQAEALIPYFIDTDGLRERFSVAMDFGVSPELWTNFYKQYSLNNGRKAASIDWMLAQGYSKKQAEYMYYLFKAKAADLPEYNAGYR